MRISDWSSDVCSSDLRIHERIRKQDIKAKQLMTHYPTPDHARLAAEGMYRPDMESDACGVGMVAATDGKASRRVVEAAIEALRAVWHRGAGDADGKTGDGAGIHVDLPVRFSDDAIAASGHKVDRKSTRLNSSQ